MPLSDADLEMLESYLDGELSGSEGDALIDRLRREPQLASTMEQVKAQRSVRMMVWNSCEPSEESVERLMARVQKRVDSHWTWTSRLARLRVVSGAAACILVGVLMGYLGRGRNAPPGPQNVTVTQAQPVANYAGTPSDGAVEVPLVDEYGKVVAVQRFDSAAQAQEFIEDMRKWQQKPEQAPNGQNVVPASSQKF